jgi:hypothetical protein
MSDVVSIEDNELSKLLEKAQGLKAKCVELDAEIAACYEDIKRVGEERRAHHDAEKALIAEAQTILSGSSAVTKPVSEQERERLANWKSAAARRAAPQETVVLPGVQVTSEDGAETIN